MNPQKVLVVDDDPAVTAILRPYLTEAGFTVLAAQDGSEALEIAQAERPRVVLLDLRIPRTQGLEVLRRLRADGGTVSVIVLSGLADEIDRILGLELGADDYVTKPFSPREVVARVKAVIRRSDAARPAVARVPKPQPEEPLVFGRLRIDPDGCEAFVDGKPLALTRTEFRILSTLAHSPSKVLSREEIIAECHDDKEAIESRTLDSHVAHLRRKIEIAVPGSEFIRTIRGIGYRFNAAPAAMLQTR